jgi:hypothetical protein
MPDKERVDYELNQAFLAEVREALYKDGSTKNVLVMPRDDDASLYASIEEEPFLLSFSN